MDRIYVRPERCTGCKSCELGCAVQHSAGKTLFAAIAEEPLSQKRLFVHHGASLTMPVICRHCEDAPCVNSCITGCLYRDDRGFIRRHKERCIGCWTCLMSCPFGVITRDPVKHLAVKCDRCHKLDVPACVRACPTGALVLADIDTIPEAVRERVVLQEDQGRSA